jgi:hypothetical protein
MNEESWKKAQEIKFYIDSFSNSVMGLAEDLLGLSELEIQLFKLLKKQSSK